MILHPPTLALIFIAVLSTLGLGYAAHFALRVLRHWDPQSASRTQIDLEKEAYLVSTLLAFVLMWQVVALAVYVFNADRMAPLFVGAMCAVGTLNASAYGFPALYAKMALTLGAVIWLAAHHTDGLATDYPLIRRKHAWLLALLPVSIADSGLTIAHFTSLQANTLTTCCGGVFSPSKHGVASDLAALSPILSLWLWGGSLAVVVLLGLRAPKHRRYGYPLYGAASLGFLSVALAVVVSTISLYIYEHPHHHCPFCLLKREYNYFGFAMYLPLFVGAALGAAAGFLNLGSVPASLAAHLPRVSKRLVMASMTGFFVFSAISAVAIALSGLRLLT